jgi:hypothetical protein
MVEQLGKLFYGPKLVGHSNFMNLRRNLVGLTEPRLLIDFARRCQNHFDRKQLGRSQAHNSARRRLAISGWVSGPSLPPHQLETRP